ncbi:MAG: peptidoglycan DD-metalloendopeptidase family protein [Cyanobacteria bacterium P01_A01_bin.114]
MKRTNSQEPTTDSSHSCLLAMVELDGQVSSGSNGRATSAAMLGIALSMGASGVLLAEGEASAAVDLPPVQVPSSTLQELPQTSAASIQSSFGVKPGSQAETVYHTVADGESLWQIAQRHRVAVKDIKVANRISPEAPLQVGQVLKVPADELANRSLPAHQSTEGSASTLLAIARDEGESSPVTAVDKPSKLSSMLEDVTSVELASELQAPSPAVTVPAIVPTEAVEQNQTLRSAGLMSQADGFRRELSQAEVAELTVEGQTEARSEGALESSVPVVATLSPSTAEQDYRVRAGDTLSSIAQSLGVTPEQLAHANGLNNPDFILAGEELVVPEPAWGGHSQPEIPVPIVMSPAPAPEAAVVSAGNSDTKLARLQSTIQNRVDTSTLIGRLQGEQTEFSSAPAPETDPYMSSLISQVESVRVQAEADVTDGVADGVTAATQAAPAAVGGAESGDSVDVAVVNPEFQNRLSGSATDLTVSAASPSSGESIEATRPDPQLLAAAPLNPEVYAPPAVSPGTGQVVSPDMPVLPDSEEYLPDTPNYFNGYIWPTHGTVTSGYGWRWGRMHRGVDVAGPVGTPIVASAPGVIERSGWNSGGYGNLVEIRHADGSMTRYAHNSRLLVRPGQQVSQGQQIAEMGSTGYSTGPHLHFEVHLPQQGTVNPVAYLPQR